MVLVNINGMPKLSKIGWLDLESSRKISLFYFLVRGNFENAVEGSTNFLFRLGEIAIIILVNRYGCFTKKL